MLAADGLPVDLVGQTNHVLDMARLDALVWWVTFSCVSCVAKKIAEAAEVQLSPVGWQLSPVDLCGCAADRNHVFSFPPFIIDDVERFYARRESARLDSEEFRCPGGPRNTAARYSQSGHEVRAFSRPKLAFSEDLVERSGLLDTRHVPIRGNSER